MLDDRKLNVLKAIVTDYVASREPVGSKALVERHRLNVSAATVRNDMAVLEEEGYITQPHTSAGRIPTDKGYRLFVDKLARIKPLSAAERRAISSFLDGSLDTDDLVARTVRLLAELTHQVAIVQYPVTQRGLIRHAELVTLSPERVMVIIVTASGRVDQAMVEISIPAEALGDLRASIVGSVIGRTPAAAADALGKALDAVRPEYRPLATRLIATTLELLAAEPATHVVVAGVPNLAGGVFDNLRPLLEALEEQVVLLRLLAEAASDDITVRIGQENTADGFQTTSLVASGYGPGGGLSASLGVVGPTRMDYPATIASVRAVARYVSRFLMEG
ncbi:heat-inducible transcriptional repressor HrcA [Tessaracoccus sp. OH4464_COT-324]|uniref:heat-inducible transcriptional repressor HrcA n=1 Tax=Tessaracoccus sp. OH4464_COT-324 TaxID=2491059 RepID=UPI000F63A01A|nr:heat-inducible transcriptional repressor HrcA [Tessaracoccus sp. OH4464_COT-324]RRD47821.1 heat-inducible transcriptional repressor HrcA [Tessaracoccus sp. OH4464_COT-324]